MPILIYEKLDTYIIKAVEAYDDSSLLKYFFSQLSPENKDFLQGKNISLFSENQKKLLHQTIATVVSITLKKENIENLKIIMDNICIEPWLTGKLAEGMITEFDYENLLNIFKGGAEHSLLQKKKFLIYYKEPFLQ